MSSGLKIIPARRTRVFFSSLARRTFLFFRYKKRKYSDNTAVVVDRMSSKRKVSGADANRAGEELSEADFGSGPQANKVIHMLHSSGIRTFDELLKRLDDSVEGVTREQVYYGNGKAWSADTTYRAIVCLEIALNDDNKACKSVADRLRVDMQSIRNRLKSERTRFNSLRRNVVKAADGADGCSTSSARSFAQHANGQKEDEQGGGGGGDDDDGDEIHEKNKEELVADAKKTSVKKSPSQVKKSELIIDVGKNPSEQQGGFVDVELRKAFNALKVEVDAIRRILDIVLKV